LGVLLAMSSVAPSPARAATPAEEARDAKDWVGRYCTPLGCRGSTESAFGNAAGFAVAAGSVAVLARRRRA
jgi:hypothetical protein